MAVTDRTTRVWPDGIEAWMKDRDYRLQTFLKVLIKHEDALLLYG